MSVSKVGFIGIGNMGWGMAANVAKAGFDLAVSDVSRERVEQFAREFGVRGAFEAKDLSDCDVIITMLPNGHVVRSALTDGGEDALASRLAPGSVIIDMSSSEPVGTKELGAMLADRGLVLIDAPVSGGVVRANSGELAIMYGSDDPAVVASALPLLKTMGSRLFDTGGLGCGHAMKALNNYMAAAAFAATSEALSIGAKFGLDQATMTDILNVSTGRNFHTEMVIKEHVVGGKYSSGFAVGLLAKDVKIAADLGRSVAEDAPLLELMEQRWGQARDTLGATHDCTEAHLAWTGAERS